MGTKTAIARSTSVCLLKRIEVLFHISLEILQNQNKNVQLPKQSDALKRWK